MSTNVTAVTVPDEFRQIPLWVVTYDLPAPKVGEEKTTLGKEKLAVRRKSYRKVRKWLQEHGGTNTNWMTLSTVITQDRAFAEFLFDEISETPGGVASIYEAHMLKFCGRPRQFQPPTFYDGERGKFMFEKGS